jgi:hypothetical protein
LVNEVDPLERVNWGSNMRIIALIDDVDVVERILKQLKVWDSQPDSLTPAGPDPPLPQGEALSLTYHPRTGAPEKYSGETVRPGDGRIARIREIGHAKRSDQVPILPRRTQIHGLPALSAPSPGCSDRFPCAAPQPLDRISYRSYYD